MLLLNFNFTVKKAEKRKANDELTDSETPRNKDLKYDREKRTRTFKNSWIDKFPWVVFDENAQEMYCTCQIGKMPLLGELKMYALMDLNYTINTRNTCYVSSIGLS
jgi:hypothetical protein